MATNIHELEQELAQLELKKRGQLEVIKHDIGLLSESMKPASIMKRGVTNWLTKKTENSSSLSGNLMGIAGTFLVEELLLRDAGLIKKLIGRLLTSNIVSDLMKSENSWIKKGIGTLTNWVKDKSGTSLPPDQQPPA